MLLFAFFMIRCFDDKHIYYFCPFLHFKTNDKIHENGYF